MVRNIFPEISVKIINFNNKFFYYYLTNIKLKWLKVNNIQKNKFF